MGTVYFVCYGNICRSPFAENYAVKRAAERGIEHWTFDSAGIGAETGGTCTQQAVTAAGQLGVNLKRHRAKRMDDIAPGPGDLVIAMDRYVFGTLAESLGPILAEVKGPGGSELRLMMHSLEDDPQFHPYGLDVPDPMGAAVNAYLESYRLLIQAVENLLDQLAAGNH